MNIQSEFDRQIENLVAKGYPKAAGLTQDEFIDHIKPLKEKLGEVSGGEVEIEEGKVSFVIVIKSELVSTTKQMQMVDYQGKQGVINLTPHTEADYVPIEEVSIPETLAYLLVDIDRGKETLNVRPNDAFEIIKTQHRSPLTIDEGLAIITHYPEILTKNNCFSLLASRTTDKTVPAIWISDGRPKLGWCWAGNPHMWLGSASCKRRVGS